MHIVYANPYFPPHAPGGAEHSLELLCRYLSQSRIKIRLITNCYDNDPRVDSTGLFEVEYVKSPLQLDPGMEIDASDYVFSKEYSNRLVSAIRSYCSQEKGVQAIIANNAPCFVPVVQASQMLGIPSIGVVRDTQTICQTGACIDARPASEAEPCKGLIGSALCNVRSHRQRGVRSLRPIPGLFIEGIAHGVLRRKLQINGLMRLDHIVTISNALKRLMQLSAGVDKKRISVVGNIPTVTRPVSEREIKEFLETNNLHEQQFFLVAGKKSFGKGSDIAAKAILKLNRQHPEIRLLFVGKGVVDSTPHESWLDLPPISQDLLIALLIRSKGLVIPGRWQEGLHRSMVDATRYGIPVICSSAGGPQEGVKDGITGYVFDAGGSHALFEAMSKLIGWSENKKEHAKKASYEIYKNKWDKDIVIDQWIEMLKSVSHAYVVR